MNKAFLWLARVFKRTCDYCIHADGGCCSFAGEIGGHFACIRFTRMYLYCRDCNKAFKDVLKVFCPCCGNANLLPVTKYMNKKW